MPAGCMRRPLRAGAPEPLGEIERVLERVEREVSAVSAGGGGDLDVAAERRPERVVDAHDRLLLVGVQDGGGATADAAGSRAITPGAGLELPDRPAAGHGVTGEAAALVVARGREERAAVTLGEVACGDQ